LITITRVNAQKYSVSAERGNRAERDEALKQLVWKHSHYVEGYQFTPKFKSGAWNGKISTYSPANIRAGYLEETIDHLEANNIPWQWKEKPKDLPFLNPDQDDFTYEEFHKFCAKLIGACKEKFDKKYDIDLAVRDYQIETAYKILTRRLGVALHATSAGKSLTIAFVLGFLFYKNLISKAVIIVPLQSLITQFVGDLLDFGFKPDFIGKLYGKEKQTNRPITIAMTNSTHNLIDTADGKRFFADTDLVICDEVHRAASKTVEKSILQFGNAKYFFGCTGTLPEDDLSQDTIFSLFGYVVDEKKLKQLREEYAAVSSVKVGILDFNYAKGFLSRMKRKSSAMDWHEEVEFLQKDDEFRNPYITNMIVNNFQSGRNIVALVKNIEYGSKMYHMIKEKAEAEDVFSIFGSGDEKKALEERDEIIEYCRSSKKPYIIVTNFQIFHVGINVPNLNMVAMIDAGKSKITVAQTIGRGVRKTRNKSDVYILDCSCNLKYGARHGKKRKKLYIDEGFTVMEKKVEEKELKVKI